MSPRLLCVWLPNWPVQRVQAEEPQLASSALVLSTRDTRRGLLVAAANLKARAAGIRPAMRLSEATALVDAEVREHDPHEDIDALCSLAEQAQQFSPIVGFEQLDAKPWSGRTLHQPECLLLDVTGLAALFGGEEQLVQQVSSWLKQKNFFGCLGLAGSLGAAWAVANYVARSEKRSQQVSDAAPVPPETNKTETQATPSKRSITTPPHQPEDTPETSAQPAVPACRYAIVPAGMDAATIATLPVAALRLQPTTIESLHRLGVRTVGQLEQLPRDGLATRLGEDLLRRWDQAFCLKSEPVVTLHSQPDWSLEQTLEYPTQQRETVTELVRRLSRELSQRLRRRGEGALRIVCRLDLLQSPPLVMQLGLFRPTNEAEHLELLLSGQLDQQLRALSTAPLWRLSLQATLTAPMVWRQAELFDGGESVNRQEFARLVDTLSSRLGRKQVLSAQVKRESQPELAYILQPMTGRRKDGTEQATIKKLSSRLAQRRAEPSREDPLRRPTQLLANPIAIHVTLAREPATPLDGETALPPTSTHSNLPSPALRLASAPVRFQYQGVWHIVAYACGPERLESGWWRGPSARRDYFRLATEQGSWWWLYRDLNTGQWYLHGLFD